MMTYYKFFLPVYETPRHTSWGSCASSAALVRIPSVRNLEDRLREAKLEQIWIGRTIRLLRDFAVRASGDAIGDERTRAMDRWKRTREGDWIWGQESCEQDGGEDRKESSKRAEARRDGVGVLVATMMPAIASRFSATVKHFLTPIWHSSLRIYARPRFYPDYVKVVINGAEFELELGGWNKVRVHNLLLLVMCYILLYLDLRLSHVVYPQIYMKKLWSIPWRFWDNHELSKFHWQLAMIMLHICIMPELYIEYVKVVMMVHNFKFELGRCNR